MKNPRWCVVVAFAILAFASMAVAEDAPCASWLEGTWSFVPADAQQEKVLELAGGAIEMVFSASEKRLTVLLNKVGEPKDVKVEQCSATKIVLSKSGESEKIVVKRVDDDHIDITTTKKPEGDEVQTFVRQR